LGFESIQDQKQLKRPLRRVTVFQLIKSGFVATSLVVVGLACGAPAQASTVIVDAKLNSTTGGVGANAGLLTVGESFSVSVAPNDLWNAGDLPRWSNANGLIGPNLIATGSDDSGLAAGTLIGTATSLWTQGGLTAPFGSLVGSIGGGNFFPIGTSFSGTASTAGELDLFYFDQNAADNTQFVTATVTTGIASAVPEPATWAMMILGFCGVGFMAYRRKHNGPALRPA
jgi:PEP-CTERM motif-containing protein